MATSNHDHDADDASALPPARAWDRRGLAVLAIGLALSACQGLFSFLGAGPSGPVFPHEKHVKEMDCTACHDGAEDRKDAGYPTTTNGCMLCHKEIDAKVPPERRVTAFLVDGKPRWLGRTNAYSGEVKFDHSKHSEAEVDCESCHAPQAGVPGEALKIHGGKTRCLACHQKIDKTPPRTDCEVCHTVLRQDVPPPSHAVLWQRSHGARSRELLAGTGATACAQCHTSRSCDECHRREKPVSHTNSWRGRPHGMVASIDRNNCVTCHQPDYCNRCHQTNAPRSHRGTFGAPRHNHCVSCHVQPAGLGCGACHRGFPGHNPGPPTPGNMAHQVAQSPVDCRGCHVALRHADPGLDCRICHK